MKRKLQVFISSTQRDLLEERQEAVQAVLKAEHIPAGMELFAAGDKTQLEVIQNWILESDVYMLILGARYGSIERTKGMSYTELEYDFAVKSGMPYFAVVLNDSAVAAKRKGGKLVTPADDESATSLASFRQKVLSKTSVPIGHAKEVGAAVLHALAKIVEARNDLRGWVRPDDRDERLTRLVAALQGENSRLLAACAAQPQRSIAALEAGTTIVVAYSRRPPYATAQRRQQVQITWAQLFGVVSMKVLAPLADSVLRKEIACRLMGLDSAEYAADVEDESWERIQAQFLVLKFVETRWGATVGGSGALFWYLTEEGKAMGLALRATPAAT